MRKHKGNKNTLEIAASSEMKGLAGLQFGQLWWKAYIPQHVQIVPMTILCRIMRKEKIYTTFLRSFGPSEFSPSPMPGENGVCVHWSIILSFKVTCIGDVGRTLT